MWDPKTGKFEHVAKSLSKRDYQGQAVVGGEIFVVGGYDNISSKYLKTGEKYSPETNKWSRLPSINKLYTVLYSTQYIHLHLLAKSGHNSQ